MKTNIDSEVSSRIEMLRFVMIFGVILLHIPLYVPVTDTGTSPFDMFKAFFQSAVFRCAVPLLTCVSGYLVFARPFDPYSAFFKKKWKALVVPFLAFNLPLVAASYSYQLLNGGTHTLSGSPIHSLTDFLNAAFGLFTSPTNYPLFFLRDLSIIMVVCVPVFSWLLDNVHPLLVLALVSLFFFNDWDGPLVLRNEMPVLFLVGAITAHGKYNMRRLDHLAVPAFVLFIAACFAQVWLRWGSTLPLAMFSPVLLWVSSSLFVNTRAGQFMAKLGKYSYFMFLAHAPLVGVSYVIYTRYAAYIPYPVYWLVSPIVITLILIIIYRLAHASMPQTFNFAIGTNMRKKVA